MRVGAPPFSTTDADILMIRFSTRSSFLEQNLSEFYTLRADREVALHNCKMNTLVIEGSGSTRKSRFDMEKGATRVIHTATKPSNGAEQIRDRLWPETLMGGERERNDVLRTVIKRSRAREGGPMATQ